MSGHEEVTLHARLLEDLYSHKYFNQEEAQIARQVLLSGEGVLRADQSEIYTQRVKKVIQEISKDCFCPHGHEIMADEYVYFKKVGCPSCEAELFKEEELPG